MLHTFLKENPAANGSEGSHVWHDQSRLIVDLTVRSSHFEESHQNEQHKHTETQLRYSLKPREIKE